ncbi:M14 family zinc carboxypeptidase [Rasiella sp. SM2506]|uniref:M14 family zinc carboxypeptidase n=1 Tax=Rasiella sp. SM2506 TaxID=3423914 RepID=UPI003D7B4B63
MNILEAYATFFEAKIEGRYVTLEHLSPLLKVYKNMFQISEIGTSELGQKIPMLKMGQGEKTVLGWSQMHGNEATTTKAIFDFLKLIAEQKIYKKEISEFLKTYTFYIIPILNPDGAAKYTRENANGIDLNRDAQDQTQSESRVLAKVFRDLQPDLCLNLHDQRTIYGFKNGKPATVSFLSPAADTKRSLTPSRKIAIQHIETMVGVLQGLIPGQIGRYDDAFNANCVGDSFQMAGVPTILFEAGHFPDDYQREETRKYICSALITLFGIVKPSATTSILYAKISENKKNFKDLLIRNVSIPGIFRLKTVAFQYIEVLEGSHIVFQLHVDEIGDLTSCFGHQELDVSGAEILVNSQQNYQVGEKVLKIVSKKDDSLLFIKEDKFL